MATITELKCPYCGKPLTSTEYDQAVYEFKKGAEEEYSEQKRKDIQDFEEQKKQLIEIYERRIETQNENNAHNLEEMKRYYRQQIEDLKNTYDEFAKQRQIDFDKLLDQRLAPYEEELYEKDLQIQELRNKQASFKEEVIEEAKASAQKEIDEHDTQINRLKEKVDELGKQLSKTQSELRGDVGEVNLLKKIKDAFEGCGDIFTTPARGIPGGDIIQEIRTPTGQLLQTKIGYDNKEAETVTARDIEKGKRDKESLRTDYFFIVSQNLPKRDIKNGLCGEKEGILLAHPNIITEYARLIRKTIIDISKESATKQDRETKQARIYALVNSRGYRRYIETIEEVHKKLSEHQNEERKDHEKSWKKANMIFEKLREVYVDMSTGIDTIMDGQDPVGYEDQTIEQSKDQDQVEMRGDKDKSNLDPQ